MEASAPQPELEFAVCLSLVGELGSLRNASNLLGLHALNRVEAWGSDGCA